MPIIDPNNPTPIHVRSNLGIQRDGTKYHSSSFIDGQWVRFFHEWPEKIGGYLSLNLGTASLVSDLYGVSKSISTDVYMARGSSIRYFNLTNSGVVGVDVDRTPTSGFTADDNNCWSFTLFSSRSGDSQLTYLIAQVNVGRNDVASQSNGPLFYGDISTVTPLVQITDGTTPTPSPVEVSGGVISLNNVLVAYGNNGIIYWTQPNTVLDWCDLSNVRNYQFIGTTKIVAAIEYFGSLLFWSLDSMIRANYVPPVLTGDPPTISIGSYWNVQVLSNNISILAQNCVVQYNQLVFWVGEGQFYIFNGSVGRLKNYMCQNWFFDNIDQTNKGKCFTWVNYKYDEIWFHYPKKGSSECNAVVIYNVGRDVWYTSDISRSSAVSLNTYPFPVMSSSSIENVHHSGGGVTATYPIWSHENGVNKVINGVPTQIQSYFEYSIMDMYSSQPGPATNILMQTMRIEPDFVMEGNMTVTVKNRMFAQEDAVETGPFTFDKHTKFIDGVISQGRQVSLRFESNVVDGNYQGGKNIHDIIPGDVNV